MDKLTISTIYTQRVTRIKNDRKFLYCERTNLLTLQLYSNVIPKKTKQYSFIIKILCDREHVYTFVMKDI